MRVTDSNKVLGLEVHAGFGVGQEVLVRAKIIRFVPEHDLALLEVQGPKGQAAVYVQVKNLEVPQ